MKKILHIHIDPLGGISGDMFISAIINADKKFINIVQKTKNKILKNATLTIQRTKKNHIEGTSLNISLNKRLIRHQSYQDIVTLIAKSKLSKDTKQLASEMFTRLAKVEAKVHGTTINKVTFHELGAWDSILDITLSAEIINYFNRNHKTTWSCGEVPLGKGSIDTAHGKIPLPAPATSLLLKGVNVIDDGIKGERVTPTGALILSTLKPKYNIFSHKNILKIKHQGIGLGNNDFKIIPNMLRVLIFEETKKIQKNINKEVLSELIFNIDDQSPEDLSISIEKIRKKNGVLDITKSPVFGKKNRITIEVKVLCRIEETSKLINYIFNETSTLGIKNYIVGRFAIYRKILKKNKINVKIAKRPSGKITKKVESKDLKNYSYIKRKTIKNKYEK